MTKSKKVAKARPDKTAKPRPKTAEKPKPEDVARSRDANVVVEIKRRYGSVIDLDESPMTIIEIIHNFRYLLDEVAGPDGTGGGPPGTTPADVGTAAVLNLLLELKRDIDALHKKIR